MTNTIKKIQEKAQTTLESFLLHNPDSETGPKNIDEAITYMQKMSDEYIPKRYIGISCEEMDMVYEHAIQEKGIMFFGECGTGKTRKVYALHKLFVVNKIKSCVLNITDFLDEIRDTFSSGVYKEKGVLENLDEYQVVIIDDLGVEKSTDWTSEMIYKLINKMYLEMKKVYITTNLDMKGISEKYGDRVASRIAEMCTITKLQGEDKRIK